MTSEKSDNDDAMDKMLGDMVRDADEYHVRLKQQHLNQTRLHVAVAGVVVWFAVFAVLGVGVFFTIARSEGLMYLVGAFLAAVVTGVVAGLAMYAIRRKRGFKFAELGALLDKTRGGKAASEDGLRLMDLMHQATLVMRKQKLDSAFEYGVVAFVLVSLVGMNAGIGALAGVVTYLYFRFEAIREFEREDDRYEVSKREILLGL